MIDRKKVVERHYPRIHGIEPISPLSVGNGSIAFTTDITGLQTFPESYDAPLGTQSHWGWHYTEQPELFQLEELEFTKFDTYGRQVGYPLSPQGHEEAYHWLRQNPHRLQLGQISFRLLKEDGELAQAQDLHNMNQILNLWEGTIDSEFSLGDYPVSVQTVCHADSDEIGVHVTSPLISLGRLQVSVHFPSPDMSSRVWEESIQLEWGNPERHQTEIAAQTDHSILLKRIMDQDHYEVKWSWNAGEVKQADMHEWILTPDVKQETFEFSVAFAAESAQTHSFAEVKDSSQRHWREFWNTGGAIDFAGSTDFRAFELERRVILSQFLTALHSAGHIPPQETGLLYNSWFGKFHLEMHWWHGAHFPLWGRTHLLSKSMDWYNRILPLAQELAQSQGYQGARWPKQVGPDGKQSPSPISPVLIWQQPHPMTLAELIYLADPKPETLQRFKDIVFEAADFMVSFAEWNEQKQAYVLGPPIIPSQENHKPEDASHPPYELEYWKYGLEIAIRWAERLNLPVQPKWQEVAQSMAKPPQEEGVYLAHEYCPDTFAHYNHDHPSMVGAMRILPGSSIDQSVMKTTLQRVQSEWQWDSAWGWDFPMCAMTAARLGEGSMAVDFLLMDAAKNTYLPNGHNYQREGLLAYLPGNGGLLTAISMMACGWQGGPDGSNPGFPQDGSWSVKWEGLNPLL
jgi:hypothetical protein